MKSSDYRKLARESLSGKWKKPVLMTLIYYFLFVLIIIAEIILKISDKDLSNVINTILQVPILYGLLVAFLKVYHSEDVDSFDFIELGFSKFARSWQVALYTLLRLLLPFGIMFASIFITSMCFALGFLAGSIPSIILGVIFGVLSVVSYIWLLMKSYYYKLASIVAIENPDMKPKEAVDKSKELMQGRRGKLFVLELSFIGWGLLCVLSLGIGLLWLVPYMEFAEIAFYFDCLNNKDEKKEAVKEDKKDDVIKEK